MGMYKYIKSAFEKEYHERSPIYRERLSKWREEGAVVRVDKPTNLARARTLGYKAKQGYIVVRVVVKRGRRKRPTPSGGRKPGKNYHFISPKISLQFTAEQRAAREYRNMEVLNSYFVGADGQKKYYEVILVEARVFDGNIAKARAFRGLTSSARKVRGLQTGT